MPPEHGIEHEKPDRVGQRNVPAVLEPQADRFRLRVHVRQRYAGGRTEPDHRAAESHRIRKIAPVVAALLERERGKRDVVEDRGDEAEAERGLPRRRRQFLHRHQRSAHDQRKKEHAAFECARQQRPRRPAPQRSDEDRGPHPCADERETVRIRAELHVDDHVDDDRGEQNGRDDRDARPVDARAGGGALRDRRVALLLQRGGDAEDQHRGAGGNEGLQHVQRVDTIDPHHGGGGVADHAARAARVRCGDDRRQVADMHLAAEHRAGDGAADQRGGDVVEERRQHADHPQQHEAALPVVRQVARQHRRHLACLEVVGKQREAEQQAEKVGENHPLVQHVQRKTFHPRAGFESRKGELVEHDRAEADERDLQRVMMEQRDAGERQAEQNELERHAERGARRSHHRRTGEQAAFARQQAYDQGSHFASPPMGRHIAQI